MVFYQKKLELIREKAKNIVKPIYHSAMSFKGHIPTNQALTAIKNYALGVPYERILFLADDSITSSGKTGFILTDSAIYFKNTFEKPQFITYSSITKCEVYTLGARNDMDSKLYIYCKDGRIAVFSRTEYNKTPLAQLLLELAALYTQTTQESQSAASQESAIKTEQNTSPDMTPPPMEASTVDELSGQQSTILTTPASTPTVTNTKWVKWFILFVMVIIAIIGLLFFSNEDRYLKFVKETTPWDYDFTMETALEEYMTSMKWVREEDTGDDKNIRVSGKLQDYNQDTHNITLWIKVVLTSDKKHIETELSSINIDGEQWGVELATAFIAEMCDAYARGFKSYSDYMADWNNETIFETGAWDNFKNALEDSIWDALGDAIFGN
jgi:hypothetical protein